MNASNTDPIVLNIIIGLGQAAAMILIVAFIAWIVSLIQRFGRWAFPLPTDTTSAPAPVYPNPELREAFAKLAETDAKLAELGITPRPDPSDGAVA